MPTDPVPPGGPAADAEDRDDGARRRPVPHDAPMLSAGGFAGPLDWLVDAARAGTIDLARLPVLGVVEVFARALEAALAGREAAGLRLMAWGDWLVMAATLALLRSRLLLPAGSGGSDAARDEAEALRRQLADRTQAAAASAWLDRRLQLGRDVFGRGQPGRRADVAGRVGDITGLFRACLVALRLPDEGEPAALPLPPLWTVPQATARIRTVLPALGAEGGGLAAFLPAVPRDAPHRTLRCRAAVAGTFVAALELARDGTLLLEAGGAGLTVRAAARPRTRPGRR